MSAAVALLALKLVSLAGSTATTAWLVSFFAFKDVLEPHRWTLLLGGLVAIAIGEGLSYLLGARLKARSEQEQA